ncbi:MAG: cell filamentation protein Fic [Pseudomonadota bacterium]
MNIYDICPNVKKAVFLAKRQLPELVTDAVNLEGIKISLPEVQTLLEGISIGGHKILDVTIAVNQVNAWRFLLHSVEKAQFILDKDFCNKLHAIAAQNEALEWGVFRSRMVTISGAGYRPPVPNELDTAWNSMVAQAEEIEGIVEKSIYVFLQMSRNKFYFNVNRRMGHFMMNGILLSNGYPATNVPAKRQSEFNKLMIDFYPSNDMQPMMKFMVSCMSEFNIEFMSQ